MQLIRRPRSHGALAAAALISLAAFAGSGGLAAAAKPPAAGTVTDIASGLAGPLQIEVGPSGTVYAAESFSGTLRLVDRAGKVSEPLAVNPTGEIGGVAEHGNTVAYTTNDRDPATFEATASTLVVLRKGTVSMTVDLLEYEVNNNPDHINTYGFESISPECEAQLPPEIGPASYTGVVDSHPYSLSDAPDGWYVGEAGGNEILHVSSSGDISVVAVLPPQPATVTAEAAAVIGLPDCAIGLTYDFEPVPTDVEVADDGTLYVSTLPGGPEDPSLGRTRVGVPHRSGDRHRHADRDRTGRGRERRCWRREGLRQRTVRQPHFGPHVEWSGDGGRTAEPGRPGMGAGRLYVSYNVFANGTVATVQLH